MATQLGDPPPQWFLNRDYSYTEKADPYVWFMALSFRIKFDAIPQYRKVLESSENILFAKIKNHFDSIEALWEGYLAHTEAPFEWPPGKFEFSAVTEILSSEEAELDLANTTTALMSIELEASEGVIIRQFKDWLEKKKSHYPAPLVKRRGRAKIENRRFKDDNFQTWADQRILQLFDLLFWRKLFQKEVSNATLGIWLFHEGLSKTADPLDKYNHSLDVLINAIPYFGSLMYEIRDWGKE